MYILNMLQGEIDSDINNKIKTAAWLNSKTQTEIKELLQRARSAAPEFKRLYQEQRMQMLEEQSQLLQAKQHALQTAQEKKMIEKERLTQDILQYGLRQTQHDVRKALFQSAIPLL